MLVVTLDLPLLVASAAVIYVLGFSLGSVSSRSMENWQVYCSLAIFTCSLVYRLCFWKKLCRWEESEFTPNTETRERTPFEFSVEDEENGESRQEEEEVGETEGNVLEEKEPSFLEEISFRILRVMEGVLEEPLKEKLQECLNEGFLDSSLSPGNISASSWTLHKANLELGEKRPEIHDVNLDEQFLKRNVSDERTYFLQGTFAVYFSTFLKLTLIRKATVSTDQMSSGEATNVEEQETISLSLDAAVRDVTMDTKFEAELLPEFPFLGSLSFCILEPVNFNIDFRVYADNESSSVTSSCESEHTSTVDLLYGEGDLRQLLFHFIYEAVFRHVSYPSIKKLNFSDMNRFPTTEWTVTSTDVRKPSFEKKTLSNDSSSGEEFVEVQLSEGFIEFVSTCEEYLQYSNGKVGIYTKIMNSDRSSFVKSDLISCNALIEWNHYWRIPLNRASNSSIIVEVWLGAMEEADKLLGILTITHNEIPILHETKKLYTLKESISPVVSSLKLRMSLRRVILLRKEGDDSAAISTNTGTSKIAKDTHSDVSRLRRLSSAGLAGHDGSASMFKRLGRILLFQRFSDEITVHDWSLSEIVSQIVLMASTEHGILKTVTSEGSGKFSLSSFTSSQKRADEQASFTGTDAVDWLLSHSQKPITSRSEGVDILKTCTDLGILVPLDGHLKRHHGFVDSTSVKFLFTQQFCQSMLESNGSKHSCVLNQGQILVFSTSALLTGSIEFPMLKTNHAVLGLGEKLIIHLGEIFRKQNYTIEELVLIPKIDQRYHRFMRTCKKLQYVSFDTLRSLSSRERICFFVNVYNALFLHSMMIAGIRHCEESGSTNSDSQMKENISEETLKDLDIVRSALCYCLDIKKSKEHSSCMLFSLYDILHGVLRCNRAPTNFGCYQEWSDSQVSQEQESKAKSSQENNFCANFFPVGDVRRDLSLSFRDFDPRIHFLLLNYPSSYSRVLYICRPSNIQRILQEASSSSCYESIKITEETKTVVLPFVFRDFTEDFVSVDLYEDLNDDMHIDAAYELLRVAVEYLPNDSDKKEALSELLVSCLDSEKTDLDSTLNQCVHLLFSSRHAAKQRFEPTVSLSKELLQELEV